MADRYLIIGGGTWVDSATDIWHSLSNQAAGDGSGIASGDTGKLDAFSGNLAVNHATTCTCAVFDATGYTGTLTINTSMALRVTGAVTIEGTTAGAGALWAGGDFTLIAGTTWGATGSIDWTGATPTVTTAAVSLASVLSITAATASQAVALADALTCSILSVGGAGASFTTSTFALVCSGFLQNDGTFSGSGTISCSGNWNKSGGTYSHTGTITFNQGAGSFAFTTDGDTYPDIVIDNNGVTTFVLQDALNMDANTLTINTAGSKFDADTHNILAGAIDFNNGTLDIGSGTATLSEAAGFNMAAGAIDGSGLIVCTGDCIITGGSTSYVTQMRHTGTSGNVECTAGARWKSAELAWGSTAKTTLSGDFNAKAIKTGAGEVDIGNHILVAYSPSVNDFLDFDGDTTWTAPGTGSLSITTPSAALTQKAFTAAGIPIAFFFIAGRTLTATGDWVVGDITRLDAHAAGTATVDMAGHDLTAADITIGGAAATKLGTLKCGEGTITCDNIADGSAAGGTLEFETCQMILADTLAGTGLTFTAVASAQANGGTINNVDLSASGALPHIIPAAAGSGNKNVEEVWKTLGLDRMVGRKGARGPQALDRMTPMR